MHLDGVEGFIDGLLNDAGSVGVINITERNAPMFHGYGSDEWPSTDGRTCTSQSAEPCSGPTELASDTSATAQSATGRKAMTLMQLLTTIREMVPSEYWVTVETTVVSRPDGGEMSVEVRAFASKLGGVCEMESGDTCEQCLERFKANVLPALGLVDVPPAEDRLAAMGV